MRLKFPDIEELSNTIENNKIYYSKDILTLLKSVVPDATEDFITDLAKATNTKSYVLVPLAYKHSHFGSLLVFSSREEATDNELNFSKPVCKTN